MHAGLNRPDNVLDVGGHEARAVAGEIDSDWWREALRAPPTPASVAIVFDYEAAWMHQIQPQGRSFNYLALVFTWYTALRRLGVDIDIVPAGAGLKAYRAVFVPSLPHVSAAAMRAFAAFEGVAVFGIRTGAKTESFQIPRELPPGPLQALLPMKVARVESLRPGTSRDVVWGNRTYACGMWSEIVEPSAGLDVLAAFATGTPALMRKERRFYLGAWPTRELAFDVAQHALDAAGVAVTVLPDDLRTRRRGRITFGFNYGPRSQIAPANAPGQYVLGAQSIGAHNFSAWIS